MFPLRSSLVVLVAGLAAGHATALPLPKDPCALVKPAEVQSALASGATVPAGVPDTSGLPLGVGCKYTWGPKTSGWGQSSVTVFVIDATKGWPGHDAATLEEGLLMKAQASKPPGSVIPGIGDAAVFTYETRSHDATVEAFFAKKNMHLSIMFHDGASPQAKDKLAALLKQAGARL